MDEAIAGRFPEIVLEPVADFWFRQQHLTAAWRATRANHARLRLSVGHSVTEGEK